MFAGCDKIININFISFDTKYVKSMKYMFYKCSNIKYLDLLSFNTNNVIDLSFMFYFCKKLNNVDLSSFNTNNAINMTCMFGFCSLTKSNISSFYSPETLKLNFIYHNYHNSNQNDFSNTGINKSNKEKPNSITIVIFGMRDIGKSCLIERYIAGIFRNYFLFSGGIDFRCKNLK